MSKCHDLLGALHDASGQVRALRRAAASGVGVHALLGAAVGADDGDGGGKEGGGGPAMMGACSLGGAVGTPPAALADRDGEEDDNSDNDDEMGFHKPPVKPAAEGADGSGGGGDEMMEVDPPAAVGPGSDGKKDGLDGAPPTTAFTDYEDTEVGLVRPRGATDLPTKQLIGWRFSLSSHSTHSHPFS